MDDARAWLATAPGAGEPAAVQPGDPWGAPVAASDAIQPAASGARRPAGVWVRALALAVDAVPVAILLQVGQWLGRMLAGLGPRTVLLGDAFVATWLLVVPGAYFVLGHGTDGQTPGKRLLGLRVVDVQGGRIGYLHALGRVLAWLVAALPLGLGLVMAGVRGDRRGLHDLLAGTKVVRER